MTGSYVSLIPRLQSLLPAAAPSLNFQGDYGDGFPSLGISVQFLDDLVKTCGEENLLTWSTNDVCEQILKPYTATHKISMCELLSRCGHAAVGLATVLVSNTGQCEFVEMVNAMKTYFKDAMDTKVWIGIFSLNQHSIHEKDVHWRINTYRKGIEKMEQIVIVLSYWCDPIPFKQEWVLWDLFCTVSAGGKVAIALPPRQQLQIVDDLTVDCDRLQKLNSINLFKCHSIHQDYETQNFILDCIQRSHIRLEDLSNIVIECLKREIIHLLSSDLEMTIHSNAPIRTIMKKQSSLSSVYKHFDKSDESRQLQELIFKELKNLLSKRFPLHRLPNQVKHFDDRSDNQFPCLGVSIRLLDEFVEICGGYDALRDYTTTDIYHVINYFTSPYKLSMCDLLHQNMHIGIDQATEYVSHCWRCSFVDTVGSLKHRFKDVMDTVVWFDLFSVNPHKAYKNAVDWVNTIFPGAIGTFGHTVLVLSPWHHPIQFSSAWCLWEIYCSYTTNSNFEIALTPSEEERMINELELDCDNKLDELRSIIDINKVESFNPEDREAIFKAIEAAGHTMNEFNHIVFKALLSSIVSIMERNYRLSVANHGINETTLTKQFVYAHVLRIVGKYIDAKEQYVDCLENRALVLGVNHPDTVQSFDHLIDWLHDQELYEDINTVIEKHKSWVATQLIGDGVTLSEDNLQEVFDELCSYFQLLDINDHVSIESNSFPTLGVSVQFLVDFVEACEVVDGFRMMSTEDVCQKLIKPFTSGCRLSMCEVLRRSGYEGISDAFVFISHAWKYKFVDVVSALKTYFADNHDTIVWFDVFSVNQHKAGETDFQWWSSTFKEAIRQFGHTVMVLSPWNDPIPLTRAWCLWELYCSHVTDCKFDVALSETDQAQLIADLAKGCTSRLNRMKTVIDVSRSTSYMPEDKERIFAAIKASNVTHNELNVVVFTCMQKAILDHLSKDLSKIDTRQASLRMLAHDKQQVEDILLKMMTLAEAYCNSGLYEQSHSLFEECFAVRKSTLGLEHPVTLLSMHSLAETFRLRGFNEDAALLLEECYEQRKMVLGEIHPDTLTTMNNLAALYTLMKMYDQAQELLEKCLKLRMLILTKTHSDTLTSMNNLAELYSHKGLCSKAEVLFKECYEMRKTLLGEKHPLTLTTMFHIGKTYSYRKKYDEATLMLNQCYELRVSVLGDDHPDTIASLNAIDETINEQGSCVRGVKDLWKSSELRRSHSGIVYQDPRNIFGAEYVEFD